MAFWDVQLGPHYDGDPRSEEAGRVIGEIICPICNNCMARLFDTPEGVRVSAWIPSGGNALGDPNSRRVGWTLAGTIKPSMDNEETAVLRCWRGHGPLIFTVGACRAATEAYRATGRRKRIPTKLSDPAM